MLQLQGMKVVTLHYTYQPNMGITLNWLVVSVRKRHGEIPICFACQEGLVDIVRMFIDFNCDTVARDEFVRAPIQGMLAPHTYVHINTLYSTETAYRLCTSSIYCELFMCCKLTLDATSMFLIEPNACM